MHPADINASLVKSGSNQSKIARSLDVTPMAICHVVYGRSKSRRIAKAISAITGLSLSELWPGKYRELDISGTEPLRKLLTRSQS